MSAFIRARDGAALTARDPYADCDDDGAAPYTWLNGSADTSNDNLLQECLDAFDADTDNIPTLHDAVEHSQVTGQDELTEMQSPHVLSGADAFHPEHHADAGAAPADHHHLNETNPRTLEDVFNLARYEPAQLQRGLMVLAGTFQIIAAAALWKAIGDRVIVTELVPPLVYAAIGVVAYLVGMRYLRIHFAQARVGNEDWLLCEQVMVAADNGVMLKARFGTAYLIWDQLLGVAQDNDFYYLLIETSQGFKVPKQGVSDPVLQTKLDDLASLTRAKALQGN